MRMQSEKPPVLPREFPGALSRWTAWSFWAAFSPPGVHSQLAMISIGFVWMVVAVLQSAIAAPLTTINFTYVNNSSDGRGSTTFQSHNQKVVENQHGLFMTYIDRDDGFKSNTWRLARSTDDGRTFSTIFQASDTTGPPAMETDENGKLYLSHATGGGTRFLRFSAANGFSAPDLAKTISAATSDAKFSMAYDSLRQRFYHATQYGQILTIDKSGTLLGSQQVFQANVGDSFTSYPHLFVDTDGVLHHAMTTADRGDHIPYESIRYLRSVDGGTTWDTMDGTPLTTPTSPEPNGPSTMINLPDEVTPYRTWLSAMHEKDGKLHFAYRAENPWDPGHFGNPMLDPRQHHMRFDKSTGLRELDSWATTGTWVGEDLELNAISALLASDPDDPPGPLFAVGRGSDGHLSALVSNDNGSTWDDYATTTIPFEQIYAVGGFREVTGSGKVIGSFGGRLTANDTWSTYFFEFDANALPISLQVNLSTGQSRIVNASDISIALNGYGIFSSTDTLNPSGWTSFQDDGQTGWEESANANSRHVSELNLSSSLSLGPGASVNLGSIYVPAEEFDATPDPVSFEYSLASGESFQGVVEFSPNTLVLQVDPSTGRAQMVNPTGFTVQLNGYGVTSESGSLDAVGWMSFEDDSQVGWEESSNANSKHVSELNLSGARPMIRLEGDGPVTLGNLFDHDMVGVMQDLVFEFSLLASDGVAGDYNNDGVVNLADYTVWRDNLGAPAGTLPNDDEGVAVGTAQYAIWKANFGMTGISSPGGTYTGVVQYVSLAGSLAASTAVSEPASALLLGIFLLGIAGRKWY